MLNREEIIKDVEKNKIIVILRGFNREQLISAVSAMEKGKSPDKAVTTKRKTRPSVSLRKY